MSLLIKGDGLFENCLLCPCCAHEGVGVGRQYYCQAIDREPCVNNIGRHADCPLSEIPTPHGRLIDADAHIQSLKENQCGERCRKNHDCVNCGIGMYIRIVENEPTVIEAEG